MGHWGGRAAHASPHRLPTEIWERCWSSCHNGRLRRLVLVCRLFREICQPLLFAKQIFHAPDVEYITPQNWKHFSHHIVASTHRLQQVRGSPRVRAVRRLAFIGSFELDLSWAHPTVTHILDLNAAYLSAVRTFTEALSQYLQLRVLYLSNLTIDTNFRQQLAALPNMVDLTLVDCDIACRVAAPLALRRLTISGAFSEDTGVAFPLSIVSQVSLQALYLQHTPDGASVLYAFVPGVLFNDLSDLQISLTEEIAARFFAFLEDCPRLEHIAILSAPMSLPQSLSSAAIPRLASFYGPTSLVETFVCRRPVNAIDLIYPSDCEAINDACTITSVLYNIAQNVVPLRSMGLPPIPAGPVMLFAVLSTLSKLFPLLRELTVDFFQPGDDTEDADYAALYLLAHQPSDDNAEGPSCEQCDAAVDSDAEEEPAPYRTVTSDGVSIRVQPAENPDRDEIISDIALNSDGLPIRAATSFIGMMDWVCTGHVDLPRQLQTLSIRPMHPVVRTLTVPEQRRAVIELCRRLPDLHTADFGLGNRWVLEGGVWKQDCYWC
ncbi:hypothetical protein B0H11DRAFT_2028362 [Mycena galericulata]|nr:hypothetical protein B0H11DRAFT_2028362 [Mycena galericulata]